MLPPPAPVVTVVRDYGGIITDYSARVSAYAKRKVQVRIQGECISACTLVTSLPPSRVCVGPQASLQFHKAFFPDAMDPNG